MALTKADIETLRGLFAEAKPSGKDCSGDVQAIVKIQATQTEQLKTITDNMNKVVLTVYGNGKPGLVTLVSGVVSFLSIIKWASGIIGGLIITLVWLIVTGQISLVK
jgi:hypothetical protein